MRWLLALCLFTLVFPAATDAQEEPNFLCRAHIDARRQGGFIGHPRSYEAPVQPQEKAYIRYIVINLANKSLLWLLNNKNNLEEAGDRVDHIHPLRFLMCIFTDEELKVGVRNIRNKSWVWGDFMGGLKSSLVTESGIDNIKEYQVVDFANTLGIDVSLIYPSVVNHRWEEFVNLLITHVPRQGNHDRYEC